MKETLKKIKNRNLNGDFSATKYSRCQKKGYQTRESIRKKNPFLHTSIEMEKIMMVIFV